MEGASGRAKWTRTQTAGIVLAAWAAVVVAGAAFPRLVYWRRRLGPRGVVIYAAYDTLYQFAVRQFLVPRIRRIAEEHERSRDELRQRLGREPTDDELIRACRCPAKGSDRVGPGA